MKFFPLQVAFLFCSKSFVDSRVLTEFSNNHIHDIDYDPNLLGKYHNDIFNTLKEKYEESNGHSVAPHYILEKVLKDYCPSHDSEQNNACIREVIDYTGSETRSNQENDYSIARSVLTENVLESLKHSMLTMNKQDTLNVIESLKEEFETDDMRGRAGKTALSFAAESYSFWSDIYNEKEHRRLQTASDFISYIISTPQCVIDLILDDVIQIVLALIQEEDFTSLIVKLVTDLFTIITSGCDTIAPTAAPTGAPIIAPPVPPPVNQPTEMPVATPVIQPTEMPVSTPVIQPTEMPVSTPVIPPTASPTIVSLNTTMPTSNLSNTTIPTAAPIVSTLLPTMVSTTESTMVSTTESTMVSTTESTIESTTESTMESTTESTMESTTESTMESTTESTMESTTA